MRSVVEVMVTLAPSRASSSAQAKPMPASLPQPVTSAERSSRRSGLGLVTGRDDAASGGRVASRAQRQTRKRRAVNWEVFITCAVTGAGDTTGKSERVPVTPAAIADVGDRGRQGRRRDRPHPRARSRDRPRLARPAALSRGRGARARGRRRRRPQPHRGHGRRSRARRGRDAAAARSGRHRPGRRDRAARARARAAARDLHARLRLDELRRGRRLRHDEHAGDAAGDGARRAGARRAARARGLRHRAPRDGQGADRRRPDRRPGADPALHRHPLRRARATSRR